MNIEQERAAFEAWHIKKFGKKALRQINSDKYAYASHQGRWETWKDRAALQSQSKADPTEWMKQHEALMHRVSKAAMVLGYGGTINGATAEQALENAETALLDHARALQSQDAEDAKFLQEDDQHDLHRFIETTEDGQGYDIGKDRIKRLAELGVVSNQGFGRYSVTAFGYWAHERYWHQNPSLPLQTIDEHNTEAAESARRVEGEAK